MPRLQHWRKRNGLTQVDAASLLGVSQPYLSLLEKGARPVTPALQSRMKAVRPHRPSADDTFRAQLAALGYPGFAHVPPSRAKVTADALLFSVLAAPDADPRVVEALLWLVRKYAKQLDFAWLVRQAKLQDLQNRLGFILQAAAVQSPEASSAIAQLERARLLQEATLCWDAMPPATRQWMRAHRTPLAQHWNILTRLQLQDVPDVALNVPPSPGGPSSQTRTPRSTSLPTSTASVASS